MSQATSDLHRKRQRSPTPSRSNRVYDVDQLDPAVEEDIAHAYTNQDDADDRDSDSNNDDETEDDEEVDDDLGNRRDTAREGTKDGTVRRTPQPRASAFTGFKDPAHELLLLKALDAVRPLGIQHGQTTRKNLSSENAEHETAMLRATGVNPQITDRLKYIQPVYEYEQACRKTADDNRDKRHRKKARTESNQVEGLLLLNKRSRTGPVQVEPDQPQPTQGFLSGTESESGISVISNHTQRTVGMKKWVFSTLSTAHLEDANVYLTTQSENQRRQLNMLVEDREERRKAEEERRKTDEERRKTDEERRKADQEARREQMAIQERQQKALMDLMALQTESMERIFTQQLQATKEQAASTERLILAIVAGFNKKV